MAIQGTVVYFDSGQCFCYCVVYPQHTQECCDVDLSIPLPTQLLSIFDSSPELHPYQRICVCKNPSPDLQTVLKVRQEKVLATTGGQPEFQFFGRTDGRQHSERP